MKHFFPSVLPRKAKRHASEKTLPSSVTQQNEKTGRAWLFGFRSDTVVHYFVRSCLRRPFSHLSYPDFGKRRMAFPHAKL
jgi:hypothetical protein